MPTPAQRGVFSRRGAAARELLRFFLAAAVSCGAASCLGVLDLDGYGAVPDALCALLDRCYGDAGFPKCRGHVTSQLTEADAAGKESYLARFTSGGCLDNCQSAWLCLDVAPVCRAPRESCSAVEQCCGFSTGSALCQRQACCAPLSAACKSDVDCCNDKCIGGTCGGAACAAAGEACAVAGECCTKNCLADGTCSGVICQPDGFGCAKDDECCSGTCQSGSCTTATCKPDGDPCLGATDCCSGACNTNLGICGNAVCLPESAPCAFNENACCGGLLCSPSYGVCVSDVTCTDNGQGCTTDDECCTLHCKGSCQCANDNEACGDGYECCSGSCFNGSCGQCHQQGNACATGSDCCSDACKDGQCCGFPNCDHDICTVGGPLRAAACKGTSVASAECIATICATDSTCCCSTWDQNCVDLVGSTCGLTCP